MTARPSPLHDYALVADGERGALVGPGGELAWMCFPSWADAPVFSGLHLGPGEYVACPREPAVTGGHYEAGTLIWRSRWATLHGIAESHEALVRPPPKHGAILLRQLRALDHDAGFHVRLVPCPQLRALGHPFERVGEGIYEASSGGVHLRWSGARDARALRGGLELDVVIPAGQSQDLVLELSTHPFTEPPPVAAALWARTRAGWSGAGVERISMEAPGEAQLAAAILRGLTCEGGGLVAAATTSLPERAETGRSYDYRYTWIRDQCYAGLAAERAGLVELFDQAVRFVTERILEDGPELRPVYTPHGQGVPAEHRLNLPGYPGSGEVRRGNRAGRQFQLDVFGEALVFLATAARHERLDAFGWRAASLAARAIEQRWSDPEAGVWELAPAHYTHSLLMCSAGLRQLASARQAGAARHRELMLADHLVRHARARATRADGAWMRTTDDARMDASLVIPEVRGAFAGPEPRTAATVRAVERELMQEGFVFRFRHDARPLGSAEGAFLLCQFWLALAYLEHGRLIDAVRTFERGRSAVGGPGLYTEEFDVEQRQSRGNLPQAFVHATLLEVAAALGEHSGQSLASDGDERQRRSQPPSPSGHEGAWW
ncbi:MAG: glycoside hydrolase family 15 protein [Deltaproteobacteria bacterium]|nr:glycoside hydrolase family 15 protein [Deltaproteobacteria bacterium]